jgi:hypothetical protein
VRAVLVASVASLALGLALSARRTSAARAEALTWIAPPACPDVETLRVALLRAAEDERAGDGVCVDVTQNGQAWHARIDMPTGVRELEGESCQALADAVIVILTLASDERRAAPPPSASAPSAAAPVASTLTDAPPRGPAPTSVRALPARSGVMLGVALFAEVGLLPAPSAGPRLSLAFSDGHWAIEFAAAALLPRHAALGGGAAPNGDIHWLGGQALVCRFARGLLRLCAGGEAGELVGEGSGVNRPTTARGPWVAFAGQTALRLPLGESLSWEAGAGIAWALMRPQFGFDDVGVLHQAGQASGRLWLGLGWN